MSTIKNDRNFRIANKLNSERFLATGQGKKWLEALPKVARSSYKVAKLATLVCRCAQLPRITPSGTDNRPVVDGVVLLDSPESLLARGAMKRRRVTTHTRARDGPDRSYNADHYSGRQQQFVTTHTHTRRTGPILPRGPLQWSATTISTVVTGCNDTHTHPPGVA